MWRKRRSGSCIERTGDDEGVGRRRVDVHVGVIGSVTVWKAACEDLRWEEVVVAFVVGVGDVAA